MTSRGKFVFTIIFLALVGFGVSKWWSKLKPEGEDTGKADTAETQSAETGATALVATQTEVPKLDPAGTYQSKDNIVDLELSVYPGYAGIIVANGGLEPNDNSIFAKKYGFKVRIKLSEEESWSALNAGKMAASATTVDVLAVYGRQFAVTVPVQIGFSRGADGVVVNNSIKRVNDLKGKILASAQFTEADFFIRYLAQEADMPVNMMMSLDEEPKPDAVNLVYAEDAFAACDAFATDETGKIVGCVTWEPKTSETVKASNGKAQVLTTNRNLLIIADILVVNKGFAAAEPEKVKGLVAGILEGNHLVRNNPNAYLDVIAKAFDQPNGPAEERWDRVKAKSELGKIHFSNGPENLAFFGGSMSSAGSFAGIYQSAVYAYGPGIISNPVDSEKFADMQHLNALDAAKAFEGQTVSIAPIANATTGKLELGASPLLSKTIRFSFKPDDPQLDPSKQAENEKNFAAIKQLLQISPGSRVLLIGHVDPRNVPTFRSQGGEALVRKHALSAMELSKNRAEEVRKALIARESLPPDRIETLGRGWDAPLTMEPDKMDDNRRVEAQWFTLE